MKSENTGNKDVLITIHSIQNIDGQDCDGP